MSAIRFGFQSYAWQMSFDRYADRPWHIMDVARQAGVAGVEFETCMIAPYRDDPLRLADDLTARGLALGGLCVACPWRGARQTPAEAAEADVAISLLKAYFPQTMLVLAQLPGDDRADLQARQANALACIRAVGARAQASGLACSFHPNSPPGSVFRTPADYDVLLAGLADSAVGLALDAGHMAKGGLDVAGCFDAWRERIAHVHFKDMNEAGAWVPMGEGVIDYRIIVATLRQSGYDGWVMVEDESALAEDDPDGAALRNGAYIAGTFA